ncbi:MAG: tRNA pseudouridine(55) synthase TruB [Lachnospiraceae bacterium]|nr:tRNA pseudouridine(55) synthase TruB [Lachnospiraceae bacterium]
MFNGLLNIHKEAGWTSSDVVAKLRGILGQKKIGHTGTLDPDATGVLVCVLGNATKLAELLTGHEKEYIAVCRLGVETDTQDLSGTVLKETSFTVTGDGAPPLSGNGTECTVSREKLLSVLRRFQGSYEQLPPMYSAVKVNGKRLYQLAREGREVERKPRTVEIRSISLLDTSALVAEHLFTMEVRCSRGTYIRTLCADIGEALGTGAAMAHLTRTRVGNFTLDQALTLSRVEELASRDGIGEVLMAPDAVFKDLERIIVREDARTALVNGNALPLASLSLPEDDTDQQPFADGTKVRIYDTAGRFFGIYRYDGRKEQFRTQLFFGTGV